MEAAPLLIALAALVAFGLVLALVVGGIYLLIRDTARRRGGWGVNVQRVACPRCDAELPRARAPRSLRQALWGGHTCPACGCQTDKWGRPVEG